MHRKFLTLLIVTAAIIAIGGMACVDTQVALDKIDETEGAT